MATRISILFAVLASFLLSILISHATATEKPATFVHLTANQPPDEYILAKPISEKNELLLAKLPGKPILAKQTHSPQPVTLKNYYLTQQAKNEVLPFWQGPKPLRLRNQFIK